MHIKDVIVYTLVGIIFGAGLIISGMVSRSKILNFLTFNENWDPSLLIVFCTAVALNLLSFQIIIKYRERPILNNQFKFPKNNKIDWKLIVGSIFFGLGWGFSGFCPGPMIMNLLFFTPHVSGCFLFTFIIGQSLAVGVQKLTQNGSSETVKLFFFLII